ncbi:hypothetical protein ABK040_014732 [Willaertia magna]
MEQHYQSEAYTEQPPQQTVIITPPTYANYPQEYGHQNYGSGNNNNTRVDDESIPSQHVPFLEIINPNMKRYSGVGIARIFYIVTYILLAFTLVGFIILQSVNAFSIHVAYGIFALFISIIISVLAFLFGIMCTRLFIETVISVFSIRDSMSKLALSKQH